MMSYLFAWRPATMTVHVVGTNCALTPRALASIRSIDGTNEYQWPLLSCSVYGGSAATPIRITPFLRMVSSIDAESACAVVVWRLSSGPVVNARAAARISAKRDCFMGRTPYHEGHRMCYLGEIDHTYVGVAATAGQQNPCHRRTSMLRQSWMQQAGGTFLRDIRETVWTPEEEQRDMVRRRAFWSLCRNRRRRGG